MEKKIIMISLLGAVMLGALIFGAIALKKNDLTALNRDHTWYVEYDAGTGKDMLVRGSKIKAVRDDITNVQKEGVPIDPPRLRLQSVEAGMAHVEIINAEYLTQRMGTSGAQNYLAATTYSLTEAAGIRGVVFIFPEGDHAAPGAYTRENFKDYAVKAQ
jgi:hypothetical protein